MDEIGEEEVDSIVTSPPYWNLKDYGHSDQIGAEDGSYQEYLGRIENVLSESYKKLDLEGSLWLIVGTFVERGDTKLLPADLIELAEEIGFVLQDVITWYKPSAIAGMNDRSVVNKREYILYFSKLEAHELSIGSENDWEPMGNLWRFPVKRGSIGQNVLHKAPFPSELSDRIVSISTTERDVVLDPFLGSGTTALSSLKLNRRAVGYEINEDFKKIISNRLSDLRQAELPLD
ncbi:DNA-methyltransferase [Halosimplex halobium]|uniref:DNA-methyltransferase n=1 Tax=Halosimplex halobium TaxID=3396618 RepID=UPI003F5591FC